MSISTLFDGYNAGYVQELFERFALNPDSVPEEWRVLFAGNRDALVSEGLILPEALRNGHSAPPSSGSLRIAATPVAAPDSRLALLPQISRAAALLQAYRTHGHLAAHLDPLGAPPAGHPRLDPVSFGLSAGDLEQIPTSWVLPEGDETPLAQTVERFRRAYSGSIGYQFEHLEDAEKVQWLRQQVESGTFSRPLDASQRRLLLQRLSEVEGLERFLHRTYLGQKRFSIEGTDVLVPMLDQAIEEGASHGARYAVLGMAHRGRLNVLTHIARVPYLSLLREFEGAPQPDGPLAIAKAGSGDVKYHHGAVGQFPTQAGHDVEVHLSPNPSHLEFVNPLVAGMARHLQFSGPESTAGQDPMQAISVLIHGDAAFAGEGIVPESLNLARLRGYSVGGTLHIIANNQVGFTTDPADSRSTRYSSDVAKGFDLPVVHVNGDDPEACLAVIRLAMAYRARFREDFVVDLVGYRRHGHNEGDEPGYTQPRLYQRIQDHPTVRSRFAAQLIGEGVLSEADVVAVEDQVLENLRSIQELVKAEKAAAASSGGAAPDAPEGSDADPATPVSVELLTEVNRLLLETPEGFKVHPKLKRQLDRRLSGFDPDFKMEWAHAEALAFGTLVRENVPIRMTGQDCERGTFSQRHLVLHDHQTGSRHLPLEHMGPARFEAYNSPLSEVAVLGFEYGYSVIDPRSLVLWEAQFGDFVNVAQVILDQFLASGKTKWGQISALTLLLPHGYEGQGPEHSSARLERFLQLCAEDNMRVVNPTTPAQYFHLLRRQALSPVRKPLVVMTPKSLLRHPRATSSVSELAGGAFYPVLPDPMTTGREKEIKRLLICSGKVYYDLATAEGREELPHVAVARIEELYPFPAEAIRELLESYPALESVHWVQEEPRNQGALTYVGPLLRAAIPREIPLRQVSRPDRASTAEGRSYRHEVNQSKLVRDALGLPSTDG